MRILLVTLTEPESLISELWVVIYLSVQSIRETRYIQHSKLI